MTTYQPDQQAPDAQPSAPSEAVLAAHGLLLRKEAALETLNARIARLGIALGISLDTAQGMQQAMQSGEHAGAANRGFAEELRGLLTLRLQMERQLREELGEPVLQQMVAQVEDHMDRVGFRHGADGMQHEMLQGPEA